MAPLATATAASCRRPPVCSLPLPSVGADAGRRRDTDQCSRTRIGYNPAELVSNVTGTDFSSASENTSKALTRVMVLHPVATGLCFIAFLLCLGTSVVGSILTALFSLLSFVVTVIAMVCDFVAFSIIRQEVNGDEDVDALARWGSGIWLMLAAAVFTLVGALVVLVTCCASRAKKRRSAAHSKESAPEAPPPAARRRFWQRGARL